MYTTNRKIFFTLSVLLISLVIGIMAILRYENLNTSIADMGFFQNNLWNLNHEPFRAFYGHFQPLYYIYSIIYKVAPLEYSAWVLLASQSLIILITTLLLLKYYNHIVALVFILHPATWYIGIGDFHFDSLIIILNTIFFILCKKQNFKFAIIVCLMFGIVKEYYILQTLSGLVYLYIINRSNHKFCSKFNFILIVSIISTLIYALLIYRYALSLLIPNIIVDSINLKEVITSDNDFLNYSRLSDDIIIEKMKYIFSIIFPLSFLIFYKPLTLILAIPNLIILIIFNNSGYFSIANHYSSSLIIPCIIAFSNTYEYLINKFDRIQLLNMSLIIILIISNIIISPSPISRLFYSDKISKYNYKTYHVDKRSVIIKAAINNIIPKNASVSVQNSINYHLLSNRNIECFL